MLQHAPPAPARHRARHRAGPPHGLRVGHEREAGPMTRQEGRADLLGRDFTQMQDYSDQTAVEIDNEVRRILPARHEGAKKILSTTSSCCTNSPRSLEKESPDGPRSTRWSAQRKELRSAPPARTRCCCGGIELRLGRDQDSQSLQPAPSRTTPVTSAGPLGEVWPCRTSPTSAARPVDIAMSRPSSTGSST